MNKQMKSKTNWLGTAVLILGTIQTGLPEVAHYLGDKMGLINMGIGVAIIILRQLTTQPISEK